MRFNMSEDSKGSNRRRGEDPNFTPAGIDLRATNSLPHGYKVRECGRRNPNQGAKDKTVKRTNEPLLCVPVVRSWAKVDLTSGSHSIYKSRPVNLLLRILLVWLELKRNPTT